MTEQQLSNISTKYVICPTCGGESLYAPSNACRPFCCDRCKQIDLGAWASEQFAMPVENQLVDDTSISH